jgi:hypothetical protein
MPQPDPGKILEGKNALKVFGLVSNITTDENKTYFDISSGHYTFKSQFIL